MLLLFRLTTLIFLTVSWFFYFVSVFQFQFITTNISLLRSLALSRLCCNSLYRIPKFTEIRAVNQCSFLHLISVVGNKTECENNHVCKSVSHFYRWDVNKYDVFLILWQLTSCSWKSAKFIVNSINGSDNHTFIYRSTIDFRNMHMLLWSFVMFVHFLGIYINANINLNINILLYYYLICNASQSNILTNLISSWAMDEWEEKKPSTSGY